MARPETLEDYLTSLHLGGWFGFKNLNGNDANKTYENLIIHDDTKTKPTEQECVDGLAKLQADYDQAISDKETKRASAKKKLQDLGLTVDEIKEAFGI
jgi:hypothetical protein